MGEPSLRPPFPTFERLIAEHDKNDDNRINRREFPTLWIFHRPDGAEAPMNGGAVRFGHADKNKDGGITAEEWSATTRELERFRSGYDTHGILAIRIENEGLVDPDKIRTLETQGIPEVPSPLYDGGYVYFVKNGGILTCLDAKTETAHRIPGRDLVGRTQAETFRGGSSRRTQSREVEEATA